MKDRIDKMVSSFEKLINNFEDMFDRFDKTFNRSEIFKSNLNDNVKFRHYKFVITKIDSDITPLYLTTGDKWYQCIKSDNYNHIIKYYDEYTDAEKKLDKMLRDGHSGIYQINKVYKR